MSRAYVIRRRSPEDHARSELLAQLNEEQRAAVLCPGGPVLVIAGAGSGKTRTLTHRAAHLIHRGLDPRNLLLCTFTNRAAREMVARVESLLDVGLRRLWAGTFHHVANLALRRYGDRVGLPDNYTILDREDAEDLLASCLAELGAVLRSRRFPGAAVLARLRSLSANGRTDLGETLRGHAPRFDDLTDEIAGVLKRYAARKLQLGLVDYDDLLLFFWQLLAGCPGAAGELQDQFEHILVDEYQDTSRLQGEIVDLCARGSGNLMVVGDDAQSIYSFRGADFQNIIDFPARYPEARVFKLERNYRSTPEVLKLANASIAVNVRQHPKVLRATRPPGMLPALIPLHDVHQQACFIAQRVLELSQEEAVPLGQIAVLYRAHSHSLELQVELTRRRIPYAVRSGLRFFEQAHIKDVVAHLRILHNAGDSLAWQRVLRLWPGVGPRTAERFLDYCSRRSLRPAKIFEFGGGLPAALGTLSPQRGSDPPTMLQQPPIDTATITQRAGSTSPAAPRSPARLLADPGLVASLASSARPAIQRLAALLQAIESDDSPGQQILHLLEGYYREYAQSKFTNAEVRIDDLLQLAEFAERYDSLSEFLSELALVAGIAAEAAGPGEQPEEKMTLSTVHQAKGLEWQAVFVTSLAEGRFPQAMATRTSAELEEERRLFHVAVTRAKDQLYLCHPRFDEGRDLRRLLRLSRFVNELSHPPLYERWTIEEAPAQRPPDRPSSDQATPPSGEP